MLSFCWTYGYRDCSFIVSYILMDYERFDLCLYFLSIHAAILSFLFYFFGPGWGVEGWWVETFRHFLQDKNVLSPEFLFFDCFLSWPHNWSWPLCLGSVCSSQYSFWPNKCLNYFSFARVNYSLFIYLFLIFEVYKCTYN